VKAWTLSEAKLRVAGGFPDLDVLAALRRARRDRWRIWVARTSGLLVAAFCGHELFRDRGAVRSRHWWIVSTGCRKSGAGRAVAGLEACATQVSASPPPA
jgi:hypothetical protein